MYNLKQQPATNFKWYGEKQDYPTDSIQVHSIGCAQNTASVVRNNMNVYSPANGIVHALVDSDANTPRDVIQLLPKNNVVWADSGYGNRHSFTIEIMESDYMEYKKNSASYTITNLEKFKADVRKGYEVAVEYVADLCKQFGFDPEEKLPNGLHRVYSHDEGRILGLSTSHVDPTHLWASVGYTMDGFRSDVKKAMGLISSNISGTQYSDISGTESEKVQQLLTVVTPIAKSYGLLPSVITAQAILESGYCTTKLSKSNNITGMKCDLVNSEWSGSVWDGKSKVLINTPEVINGKTIYKDDYFRVYKCIEDCIKDMCAFFTTMKKYVNAGIKDAKSYKEQITIISKCGYATDPSYISKVCSIIEKYNLDIKVQTTEYKVQVGAYSISTNASKRLVEAKKYFPDAFIRDDKDGLYRVQVGSFSEEANAKKRLKEAQKYFPDAFIKEYKF